MEAKSATATLAIYRRLVEAGPTGMSVGEIAASVTSSPPTLSFHLKELSHAGLIRSRQEGRYIFYSSNYSRMNALIGFLTENCCVRGCGPGSTSCRPGNATTNKRRKAREPAKVR